MLLLSNLGEVNKVQYVLESLRPSAGRKGKGGGEDVTLIVSLAFNIELASLSLEVASLILEIEATAESAWTEKDQLINLMKEECKMSMKSIVGGKIVRKETSATNKGPDEFSSYEVLIHLERFYILAGNPVKEILLKLNLPDHSIKVKEFQRSFRHSDTERLSQSDEVLKLKNFKKDATLKLFMTTIKKRYEHVGPKVTSSQMAKEIVLG
ncbi:hypothetical protein Tco_0714786 [Tanacetum coccineum]